MKTIWTLRKADRVMRCEIDVDRAGGTIVRLLKAETAVIRCRFLNRAEGLEHAAQLRRDLESDGWSAV